MTQSPSSQTNPPLTFVVYTRRAPSASLSAALIRHGHSVMERGFSAVMHELLHDLRPDLLVVCVDPADPEDLSALERLMLAARNSLTLVLGPTMSESTVLPALELGVDCCMSADISTEVIAAQAQALLRRFREDVGTVEEPVLRLRDLTIDFDRRRVSRGSDVLDLTRTEFDILGMLARNPGRVVSASEILAAIGQYARSEAQARVIVKVHISHLRQKLEAGVSHAYVETIRGVGYLLERREGGEDNDPRWEDVSNYKSGTG
jgi:DNA-binding response OmpR family regulator